jgi:hypothetical protein
MRAGVPMAYPAISTESPSFRPLATSANAPPITTNMMPLQKSLG